jgi:hypothetical protein
MGAEYNMLRGLVFRDAPGTAIGAGTGWHIEDCVATASNLPGDAAFSFCPPVPGTDTR